jgi:hypothetical protein
VRGKKEAAVSARSTGAELGDEERRSGETSRAEIDVNEASPSETSRDRIDAHAVSPGETQPEVIDTAVIGAAGTNKDTSAKPPSPESIDTMKTPRQCHPHATSPPAEGAAVTARYVPAPVRREVCARDGARCSFVSADGVRCRETRLLELHRVTPHARNGATTADNLALYCRTHNALAAERDFGRAFMARRSGRDLRPPEFAGG